MTFLFIRDFFNNVAGNAELKASEEVVKNTLHTIYSGDVLQGNVL